MNTDERRYSGKKEGKNKNPTRREEEKGLNLESRKVGRIKNNRPATAGQINAASAFGLNTEHPGLTPFGRPRIAEIVGAISVRGVSCRTFGVGRRRSPINFPSWPRNCSIFISLLRSTPLTQDYGRGLAKG